MEKSKIIILIIGLFVIVGAIIALIAADANDTTVLTIGKSTYDLADFASYGKVWYYEDNSQYTESYDTMLSQFYISKLYNKWAENAGVELESGEMPAPLESGDEEILLRDYNLTADEYYRVQKEIALKDKLRNDSYNLGKVPEGVQDYYFSYLNQSPTYLRNAYALSLDEGQKAEDLAKTVDYRVFMVPIEHPSGDTSGDVSGDVSGEVVDPEVTATLNAKLKAQEAMASIKQGIEEGKTVEEAFTFANVGYEEVTRYAVGLDYIGSFSQIANGELSTLSKLFATRAIEGSYTYMFGLIPTELATAIEDAVLNQDKGTFSDIVMSNDYAIFIYVEDVRDGFEGTDLEVFNIESANCYIELYYENVSNKAIARKAKLEELPGVIAKKAAEEAQNQENSESGDAIVEETSSGDLIEVVGSSGNIVVNP
ncbi:MAG: hypothetical protein IKI57_02295 [Clostridia bacterium]|nr:hypothetical protein [Clostridia bacterium]